MRFTKLHSFQKSIKENEVYFFNTQNAHLSNNCLKDENELLQLIHFDGSQGILSISSKQVILWLDQRYLEASEKKYKESFITTQYRDNPENGLASYLMSLTNNKNTQIKLNLKRWNAYYVKELGLFKKNLKLVHYERKPLISKNRRIDIDFQMQYEHNTLKKLQLIQRNIKQKEIHFISNSEDISWILNIRANDFPYMRSVQGKALITKHQNIFFTTISQQQLRTLTHSFPEWKIVNHESQWEDLIHEIFKHLNHGELHYTFSKRPGSIDIYDLLFLKKHINPNIDLHARDRSIIEPFRLKKTNLEIKTLNYCGQHLSKVMTESILWIQKKVDRNISITEKQIQTKIHQIAKSYGSQRACFEPIVASGPNSAFPHHIASESKKITSGELLMLDIGFYFDNHSFATDMTRTFLVGSHSTPTQQQRLVYTTVLKAFLSQYGVKFEKDTLKAKKLDSIGRLIIKNSHLEHFSFVHSTGHGLGIIDHELGITIGPASNITLRQNYTYSIEPGVYASQKCKNSQFGIRIEDIVCVKKMGELLCHQSFNYHPFDERLIDYSLLTNNQRIILDHYLASCK